MSDQVVMQVERILKEAAYGLKLMVTKASRKIGKFMLHSCRGNLDDVGHGHRLDMLLETHGLPMDIDSRQSSGEADPMPDPPTMEDMANFYVGYLPGHGGDTSVDGGPSVDVGTSASVDAGTSASADVVFGPGAESTPAAQTYRRPYVVGSSTQRMFNSSLLFNFVDFPFLHITCVPIESKLILCSLTGRIQERRTRRNRGEPPERYGDFV